MMAEAPTHSPEAMKFRASGIAIVALVGTAEEVMKWWPEMTTVDQKTKGSLAQQQFE